MPLRGSRSTARYMCIASAGHIHPIRRQYASVPAGRCEVYVHRAAVYVHRGSQAIYFEFYVYFHTRLTYTSGAFIICVWDEQGSCTGQTSFWPHSSAIFWFSTGVLWKSGKPSGFHMVKRSDYITNSVRCQGTVIFLNKMKGESGRCDSQNTGTVALFLWRKSTNIGLYNKLLSFGLQRNLKML
jgi:hypothetical protein